jgi:F-type H+-transporting ATPase subunit a
MSEARVMQQELPNLVSMIAERFRGTIVSESLLSWENVIFSIIIIGAIVLIAYVSLKNTRPVPSRLQNAAEAFAGTLDDFVCGILGPQGRKFTPFIGTLFIYIIVMNLSGLIPLMKSPTSSWSTTLALALCVFIYVQYAALKGLGVRGYVDHLMGKPRGILAFSVLIPLLLFCLHVIAELVRPISLSLRLRSNIWGDDVLLAIMSGFGLGGLPLLFFNTLLTIISGVVQAIVFCLLTTIYFALVLVHEE